MGACRKRIHPGRRFPDLAHRDAAEFSRLFAHQVFAHADVRHHEIHIGKRRFWIGGVAKLNLQCLFLKDNFARLGDGFLTCAIVVIKLQGTQREAQMQLANSIRTIRGVKVLPPPAMTTENFS